MPLLVRWPGMTSAGAECSCPVVLADLFPTLVAAGAPGAVTSDTIDGRDLAPVLKDPTARLERDALYFHYPHYYETTTPVGAVRAGDWKLLEYFEDGRRELFNLKDDPGEQHDLAAKEPAKAAELQARLAAWRKEADAQLPKPNPAYRGRN